MQNSAAPILLDIPHVPNGGIAHWRYACDGVRLRLAHWSTPNTKGTVMLCPGRTEYIEKYGHVINEFQNMGLSVVIIDWRGQGLSDRLISDRFIGHVDQFLDFQKDIDVMAQYIDDFRLPKPLFTCAHSMGGAITLRALLNGLDIKASVFSAPMWGLKISAPKKAFAWVISALANPFPIRKALAPGEGYTSVFDVVSFENSSLTTDLEMYKRMASQVRQHTDLDLYGPSIAWAYGALRETRALSKMSSPDVPCLTFLGTQERLVDPSRIQGRMAQWPNGTLEIIEGGKHEIMMETKEMRDYFFHKTAAHFGV